MTAATRFALVFLVSAAAMLAAVAAYVAKADPYMLVWRQQETRGQVINDYMRAAKAAQAALRRYDTLLVGSSTTYRGLDPDEIAGRRAYNLGLSSLYMTEARHYIDHALLMRRPRTIVLGMEFFMFDENVQSLPGFDPGLGGLDAWLGSLVSAFVGRDAIAHARARYRQARDDPDGVWHANGFKASVRPGAERDRQQVANAVAWYGNVSVTDAADAYRQLEHIVAQAAAHDVELLLYFSPQRRDYLEAIARAGHAEAFRHWQANVRRIAERAGVPLFDFMAGNPCMAAPLPAEACFIDPSHYAPDTQGAAMLAALGFDTRSAPGQWAIPAAPSR